MRRRKLQPLAKYRAVIHKWFMYLKKMVVQLREPFEYNYLMFKILHDSYFVISVCAYAVARIVILT
ncbi:hypothetical protein TSAR_004484 [Trichomalopsis sarcophagae]|uniref:Uncharacterized protein n=1 Tax=Trichomalopsis sarcophagae TaxID=543379 RepID=A0A232FIC7_9HYME|nr:hypothetical protein TSAR_004484 [Trichomalopsis sarcophagae]